MGSVADSTANPKAGTDTGRPHAIHTAAPWQRGAFDRDGRISINADGYAVALVCARASSPRNNAYVECEANARLIAAAPDLLAALKQAERVMTDADLDHQPTDDEGRQALEAVRAAIALAEGR